MFLNLCYFLNAKRLSFVAALLRLIVALVLLPVIRVRRYSHAEKVAGYYGWLEAPGVGCLAFFDVPRPSLYHYQWRW